VLHHGWRRELPEQRSTATHQAGEQFSHSHITGIEHAQGVFDTS